MLVRFVALWFVLGVFRRRGTHILIYWAIFHRQLGPQKLSNNMRRETTKSSLWTRHRRNDRMHQMCVLHLRRLVALCCVFIAAGTFLYKRSQPHTWNGCTYVIMKHVHTRIYFIYRYENRLHFSSGFVSQCATHWHLTNTKARRCLPIILITRTHRYQEYREWLHMHTRHTVTHRLLHCTHAHCACVRLRIVSLDVYTHACCMNECEYTQSTSRSLTHTGTRLVGVLYMRPARTQAHAHTVQYTLRHIQLLTSQYTHTHTRSMSGNWTLRYWQSRNSCVCVAT